MGCKSYAEHIIYYKKRKRESECWYSIKHRLWSHWHGLENKTLNPTAILAYHQKIVELFFRAWKSVAFFILFPFELCSHIVLHRQCVIVYVRVCIFVSLCMCPCLLDTLINNSIVWLMVIESINLNGVSNPYNIWIA